MKEKTAFERFMSQTPVFFKKVQLFGTSLTALGTSFLGMPGMTPSLVKIGTSLLIAGPVIVFVAQFACVNATAVLATDEKPV